MKMKFEKPLAIISCILGVAAVLYGMAGEEDILFIIGLLLIAGGYLIIRRRLKNHAERQNP
jgi:LPXTG-motif cell wall-anchored protein